MTQVAAAVPVAATLPPLDRRESEVVQLLGDATFGLPPAQEYPIEEYKPRLALEAIGQPTIAVGADRFGAAIGGGMGFFFSDMLGDQNLAAVIQLSTLGGNFSFKNTAGQVAYTNQANRWNWGVIAGQVPYISGGVRALVDNVNRLYVEETVLFRQTDRSAAGMVAYPFNRAERIEFQAGMSQISFDQIVQTDVYDLVTGSLLARDSEETSLADPLSLGTTSAALVHDTSVFGATSPVAGSRYRLEIAPTFGGVNFASVLTDYRRYFMPAPFYTFAGRVLHYGRYGSGGEDDRLFPLYLGYPTLVRGYDVGTLDASECLSNTLASCPIFNRLMGSRVLVGNLEFRFPLLRPFGASPGMYGPLPVELALFADGGIAWNRGDKPSFFGGEAEGVSSVGLAFRVNLMGFAVGEFDLTRPLQRAEQGWVFQFHLSPGF
jgi:outer membrane protein assembly factor BamA